MRRIPDEIAEPVLEWIDDQVPTPDRPPCINATVKLEAVLDHLLGNIRGSDGPISGTRTYVIDVKFYAAHGIEQAAIDQLLSGLRRAAGEDPRIAGLPDGGRLSVAKGKVEAAGDHHDPDQTGPIITLGVPVSVPEG